MRSILPTLFLGLATSLFASACVDGDEGDCEGEECHAHDEDLFSQAYEENLEDPKADTADCSGVRVPDRSGFGKKIALTFDDGPNPATTPKVIEVLKRHRAPAAFFTNGSRYGTAGARELAARIAADPDYILANHSQNHKNLSQESASSVASEFTRTDALIRAAGETPKYFRFPFGASTCASKTYIQGQNNIVTGWHVDSADWCYARGDGYCKKSTFRYVPDEFRDDMGAYILSQVRSTNGGIVLFHDVHQSTADNLDAILTALENEGYTSSRASTARRPRRRSLLAMPAPPMRSAASPPRARRASATRLASAPSRVRARVLTSRARPARSASPMRAPPTLASACRRPPRRTTSARRSLAPRCASSSASSAPPAPPPRPRTSALLGRPPLLEEEHRSSRCPQKCDGIREDFVLEAVVLPEVCFLPEEGPVIRDAGDAPIVVEALAR